MACRGLEGPTLLLEYFYHCTTWKQPLQKECCLCPALLCIILLRENRMWNLKFKQWGPCMDSEQKQCSYKRLLKYRDERKVLPPSHTNFQKRVFLTQELQTKRKPQKNPWLLGNLLTPKLVLFPVRKYSIVPSRGFAWPLQNLPQHPALQLLSQLLGSRAVKVIPATQPTHSYGTRKMNFNSQAEIFYRKHFQRSVQTFSEATALTMHSAGSISSQPEGEEQLQVDERLPAWLLQQLKARPYSQPAKGDNQTALRA